MCVEKPKTIIEAWETAYAKLISDCERDGEHVYNFLNGDNYSHITIEYRPDYEQWFGMDMGFNPEAPFPTIDIVDELDTAMFQAFKYWADLKIRKEFESDYKAIHPYGDDEVTFKKRKCNMYEYAETDTAFQIWCKAKGIELE